MGATRLSVQTVQSFILMVFVSFLSCHKYRDILLCISHLLFLHSKDTDLFAFSTLILEITLMCWYWAGKCLPGTVTISDVLIYFMCSVFVDVN